MQRWTAHLLRSELDEVEEKCRKDADVTRVLGVQTQHQLLLGRQLSLVYLCLKSLLQCADCCRYLQHASGSLMLSEQADRQTAALLKPTLAGSHVIRDVKADFR